MSPCNEESSSGSASTSQSVTVTPAEGSTEEGPQNETKQMNPDNQALIPQADHEGANPSASPPEMSEVSDRYSSLVQLVQEGKNASVTPERTLLSSPRQPPSLPTGQGGSVPSGKAEKASVDGYNWRKYGQKNVKGNEFIRSYYKCTHPNCLVKKQVERSLKGQIIDTVYFGQHDHPKPHVKVPVAIGIVASIVEPKPEKASPTVIEGKPSEIRAQTCQQVMTTNTCLSLVVTASNDVKMKDMSPTSRSRAEFNNDDDHSSKRKKKENHGADAASVNKATGEARLIIQTMSEVDSVNDGYRWRKYGQKLVKGNPNPRSYYRCSSPGCPVKKHVERTSHDPKVVMTTYEGQHDHNMPAVRIVTRNSAGADGAAVARSDDEARTKSEECQAMCADAAERQDSSVRLNHLAEHQNNKSENKQDATGSTTPEHESKSNMQKKDEPLPHCKSQGEKDDPSDSGPRNMLTVWQPSSQLTAKPEESEGACINKVGKRSNEQEQVLNTAAAIQS